MRPLPGILQPLLTWITGKPLQGQEPFFKSNSATQTLSALFSLFGGAAYGFWVIAALPAWAWPGLIPGWLLVAGAARKIQVTLVHQCAHFNFSGNKKRDQAWAQALSTLVLTDHFDSYFHDHIRIHHTKRLGSSEDPDCKFLLNLGFRPGMSEKALWIQLARTVFSPSFHGQFLAARLRSNFLDAPPYRRLMALAYHGAWLAAVSLSGAWAGYVAAWWIPLTLVYHVAALLNFSSLHIWLKAAVPGESSRNRLCSLTAGRFLGEPAPAPGSPARAWLRWSLRMLVIHLPARVAVLSGDLPVHDYHHRRPRCPDWANFLYTRQRDLERGSPGWGIPYEENWGLIPAISAVFKNLSLLEPQDAAQQPAPLSDSEAIRYAVQL